MSRYSVIKAATDAYIKTNGRQEITGAILNAVMIATIDSLGKFYQFVGSAVPDTDPGNIDQNVAFLASTPGTYTKLGSLSVGAGEVAVLKFDGQWKKEVVIVIPTKVSELINDVGYITNAVSDLVNYYTKAETYSRGEIASILANYYDRDEVDSLVSAIVQQTYVVAWDGTAEPVVADIPAGVSVTYGGNPYVGTLAASASTINKIYLVSNGAGYDEYITTENSGYAWIPIGTTNLDLSGYATTAQLGLLSADVDGLEEDVSIIEGFYIDDVEEDATSFDLLNYYITDQGKWSTNSGYKHCEIPIEPGTPVRVTASAGERAFVSFLKTNTRTSGGDVDVCSSLVGTWRIELAAGETRTLVAPSDANYFYFYRGLGAQSYPYTPSEIIFILPKIDAEEVNASMEEVEELREDVGETAFPSVTQDCSNTTWVSGNILAVSGSSMGSTGTSTANSHTDYIELGGIGAYSRVLRYTRGNTTNSSSNAGLVFYDANKDALDFQKMVVDAPEMGYSMEDLPVPANAKYFRTTIRNEDVTNFSATLTITTKEFTSGLGKEVQDMQEDVDYLMGLAPGQYKPFNVVGSPVPYIPTIDTTGLSVFSNLTTLYDAFDALVTAHPDWFKKEADLGMDASNTYAIRHYSLRFQHPLITNDRAGDGMNLWDDTKYKYRRIIVNMGIHATEKYSVLGGYLAVKAILESNDPWAKFIKDNFVIDVIPSSNPWGLMNNSSQNANGYNLNRTFFENVQAENTAIINLIADLKPKGLVGVIDLHNTGLGDSGGNSYFVAKPTYKFWDYYAVLVQQLQALLYDFTEAMFGTSRDNHFHLWDGSANSGQLHQYADSQGLLGGTVEVSSGQGVTGSFLTEAQVVNLINAFGTFTNV